MTSRRNFIQSSLALSSLALAGGGSILAANTDKASRPLNILFLGGTGFLGPHTVQAAIDRGHKVTLFNRGRSNTDLFPGLEKLVGNRDPEVDQGLSALEGRQWDCVIDTSAYVPRIADASSALLANSCQQYLFISSISVYKNFAQPDMDETAPVGTLEDATVETVDGNTYGPLKAYCEQAVQNNFGSRATILRPGLIVGPRDRTDRYTYWPARVAEGGQILAPGDGTDKVQYIDVRDLGAFIIRCLEQNLTGVYNTTSDAAKETVHDMIESCRQALNPAAEPVWVDLEFLTESGVRPWADLPVWVPNQGEMGGLTQINVSKAMAAGMTIRPRTVTAKDTYAWFSTLPEERRKQYKAGMTRGREQEVLTAWREKQVKGEEVVS